MEKALKNYGVVTLKHPSHAYHEGIFEVLAFQHIDVPQSVKEYFGEQKLKRVQEAATCVYYLSCEKALYENSFRGPEKCAQCYHHMANKNSLQDTPYTYQEFLSTTKGTPRVQQYKSGPQTVLLGGNLHNKATIRIIPEQGVKARLLATLLGVPCEEILTNKEGKPRIYEDHYDRERNATLYRVYTKVENSPSYRSLLRFLGDKNNQVPHKQDLVDFLNYQQRLIESYLYQVEIGHKHSHNGNYLVYLNDGLPFLRLIDRDLAKINKVKPSGKEADIALMITNAVTDATIT